MMPGGIFNNASTNYSPETAKILKVLTQEAKLSIKKQNELVGRMLSNVALPRVQSAPAKPTNLFNLKKNYYFSKRTQEQMKKIGAFDVDYYIPKTKMDRPKEIQNLQEIMEFGRKIYKPMKKKPNKDIQYLTKEKRIAEINEEISERVNFLDAMQALGQGKRYENIIKQEISSKLIELEKVEGMTEEDFTALRITT